MAFKARVCIFVGSHPQLQELHAAMTGWEVVQARTLSDARRLLLRQRFEVGLLSLDVERDSCGALDDFLREHWTVQWVAVLHAQAIQQAPWRQLVQEHCCDFHTRPIDPFRLGHTVGHAHGLAALRGLDGAAPAMAAPPSPHAAGRAPALTGASAAIARLRSQIVKVAKTSAPVLIWGESGSGKELAANAVHAHSARAAGPFVPINCGAMPAGLIQSELFGHQRGAFTGAMQDKRGLIEAAAGGSLFLDEIADLPLESQANLLRFLQEKTIYRLGATHSTRVEVRVIAATHVNLQQAVAKGTFREDLYYRLNVLVLEVPTLRERKEDLALLAEHIFQSYISERAPRVRGFSGKALAAIEAYHWPGNVRELINRVRRAMVMADGRLITPQDLGLAPRPGAAAPAGMQLDDTRVHAERGAIEASLLRVGNNVTLAARQLGVSRMTLYRLLAKHGMSPPARGDARPARSQD